MNKRKIFPLFASLICISAPCFGGGNYKVQAEAQTESIAVPARVAISMSAEKMNPVPLIIPEVAEYMEEIPAPVVQVTNRWNITLSEEEKDLLAKIVFLEARGESDEGKIGVIEVIFNRMIHPEFKGSLLDIVSAENQFCSWYTLDKADPGEREYMLIGQVLSGNSDLFNYNVVYFSTSPRNNCGFVHIGNHYFCEFEE